MSKRDIPCPSCVTCGEADKTNRLNGETTFLCSNCGTEMRFMPAGELLHSGGSQKAKELNGWVVTFSVRSSEVYSSKVVLALGGVIVLLSFVFLALGKIGVDAVLWSAGSGILLTVIGNRRLSRHKRKTQKTLSQYPYWQKE